jgi:hypothetical protein
MISQLPTVEETLDQLGEMGRRPLRVVFMTEEEIAAQLESKPLGGYELYN